MIKKIIILLVLVSSTVLANPFFVAVNNPVVTKTTDDLSVEQQQHQKIKEYFDLKETQEKDKQLACVAKGTNPKTCVDPHWCLYPNKFNTDECTWYRIKYDI